MVFVQHTEPKHNPKTGAAVFAWKGPYRLQRNLRLSLSKGSSSACGSCHLCSASLTTAFAASCCCVVMWAGLPCLLTSEHCATGLHFTYPKDKQRAQEMKEKLLAAHELEIHGGDAQQHQVRLCAVPSYVNSTCIGWPAPKVTICPRRVSMSQAGGHMQSIPYHRAFDSRGSFKGIFTPPRI